MTTPIEKPNTKEPVADAAGVLSRSWRAWFDRLLLEMHKALVPPKGIIPCYLLAADIAAEFDATGLGRDGGPYQWWAICNGLNGTPDLTDLYIKHSNATAGTASGSFTTSASSAANTGNSAVLTTDGPSVLTNVLIPGVGLDADVGAEDHTHSVPAHAHTIAHTHTAEPPSTTLVYLMRVG